MFDEPSIAFAWRIQFDPDSQYLTLDDRIWTEWQTKVNGAKPPRSIWLSDLNTVRFALRPLGKDLKSQTAYEDLSMVLQFLRAAYPVIAQTVGADPEGESVQDRVHLSFGPFSTRNPLVRVAIGASTDARGPRGPMRPRGIHCQASLRRPSSSRPPRPRLDGESPLPPWYHW